ncbi:cytochrome P450 [Obba rivulosa]|uniref:Cytochrome P450 n=1 Tax=Obba rivulosa TaxID=1052685 RepID=A0A8E2DKG7_9APHY|nr:cytochrome P450 [Obba rivulosa]
MSLSIISALPLVILLLVLWRRNAKSSGGVLYRGLPLPPGPKPLPIIGNALDVPVTLPWRTYAQWAREYGDLLHLRIFGKSIIVLNSFSAVSDLFEKRSTNYSDRPQTEMTSLTGWTWVFAVAKYGEEWRRKRRDFYQYFNQTAVRQFEPQIRDAAQSLLRRLYHEPKGFADHIQYAFGATMLSVLYGIQAEEKDDKYIAIAERALDAIGEVATAGKFWVDFVPLLRYIPIWMPGAEFQRKAAKWKLDASAMKETPWHDMAVSPKDGPYAHVALGMSEQISSLIGEAHAREEEISKSVCGAAYAGGSHTTVSTMLTFFLAMVLYPDVQRKAQLELEAVVGSTRLPDFSDKEDLPYINALCMECLRWQPASPLALPHKSMADDEYNGYFIPACSILLQNSWAILHDPDEYPDPEKFRPERFLKNGKLNDEVRDPAIVAFGLGRRTCPGRFFINLALYMDIAYILHTFSISSALDDEGNPLPLEANMTSASLSCPIPFGCTIKPRSKQAELLIQDDKEVQA